MIQKVNKGFIAMMAADTILILMGIGGFPHNKLFILAIIFAIVNIILVNKKNRLFYNIIIYLVVPKRNIVLCLIKLLNSFTMVRTIFTLLLWWDGV